MEQQQRYMADGCAAYFDLRYQEGVMLKREDLIHEMHARAYVTCDVVGHGQVIKAKVYKP